MRRPTAAAAALGLLLLAGCSTTDDQLLATYDLAGMDAPAIIDHLDRLPVDERPADLMASVRPDALLLGAGEEELALEIPDDRFYVSVAPYADGTHAGDRAGANASGPAMPVTRSAARAWALT